MPAVHLFQGVGDLSDRGSGPGRVDDALAASGGDPNAFFAALPAELAVPARLPAPLLVSSAAAPAVASPAAANKKAVGAPLAPNLSPATSIRAAFFVLSAPCHHE